MEFTAKIKQEALDIGFDLVGITTAEAICESQIEYFNHWLAKGFAGGMDYMKQNQQKRFNPAGLLESARSVICVGLNYKIDDKKNSVGKIANFAMYEDYHQFMKKKLFELVDFMISQSSEEIKFKACVDSVPIAERALAQRAGLGFIGKNHMLINSTLGLQILLGEIITDLKLRPDEPIVQSCDNCDKCIKSCPTGALGADGGFDSNKCISYLTIEHKGEIPKQFAGKIGTHLFGCDECINACPYDKKAPERVNKDLRILPALKQLNPANILDWEKSDFDKHLAGSSLERLGLERLKRNAKVCLDNYGTRNVSVKQDGTSTP